MNTDEGRQKYKSLDNQLRRATDKAREKWWEEQCSELEQYGKQGRMDLMYRRVAELTKQKKKKHNTQVKDRHGKLLTEEEEVKCQWKEYIEELYDGTGKPLHTVQSLEVEADVQDDDKGPSFLYSEFEKALEELKNKKASGPDGIPAELLKALGSAGKRELFEIPGYVMKYTYMESGQRISWSP